MGKKDELVTRAEQHRTHPLWSHIESTRQLLRDLHLPAEGEQWVHAQAIEGVLALVSTQSEAHSPLVTPAKLTRLQDSVLQVKQAIELAMAAGPEVRLDQASGLPLDRLASEASCMPWNKDRYTRGLLQLVEALESSVERQSASVDEAVAAVGTLQASLIEDLAKARLELSAAQTSASAHFEELKAQVATQTKRIDEEINRYGIRYDEVLEESRKIGGALNLEFRSEFAKREAEYQREVDGLLTQLRNLLVEATNVVTATAEEVTARSYATYADEQSASADRWRLVAVGSFFGVFLLYAFILVTTQRLEQLPWQLTAFKITGSAGLLAVGTYAAKESSRHRRAEWLARSIHLDIHALGPFIANLGGDEQREIRASAARRLFVKASRRYDSPHSNHADESLSDAARAPSCGRNPESSIRADRDEHAED